MRKNGGMEIISSQIIFLKNKMIIDLKKNSKAKMNCEIKVLLQRRGLVHLVYCFTDIKIG